MNGFLIIYAILGFFSAIISYGLVFGYLQNRWPSIAKEEYGLDILHACFASFFAIVFPVLMPLVWFGFCQGGRYGLKYK